MGRWFIAFCWVPAVMLAGTMWYVNQFEGWGQWAAGPMLLLPVIVSLAMTVSGLLSWWMLRSSRSLTAVDAWPVALAGIPLLWLGYRWVLSW